jgi:pilus assembly protein CpaE
MNEQWESDIVLVGRDEGFEQRVRHVLADSFHGNVILWTEGLEGADADGSVDAIARRGADVVAVGPGLDTPEWTRIAAAFDHRHPEIGVVVVTEPAAGVWEAALRAGVRDVVAPDAPDHELRSALERALGTAARRRANLLGDESSGPANRVITVMGPKGGVGKTTVSTNLAVGLAAVAPGEVVLVDLDLQFGDVANALHVEPDRTIADALRAVADDDLTHLKAFLALHPTGVYALYAPDAPAEVDKLEPERVSRVVRLLGDAFRYVVVDTAAGLDEFTLAGAEAATDFVLVAVTDVPSVRSMRKEVEALDYIGMTSATRHLVLNRADRPVGLSRSDIERTIGMRIDVEVPSAIEVTVSMNQGCPLLAAGESSPTTDALLDLVGRFADVPVDGPAQLPKRRGKIR